MISVIGELATSLQVVCPGCERSVDPRQGAGLYLRSSGPGASRKNVKTFVKGTNWLWRGGKYNLKYVVVKLLAFQNFDRMNESLT